jgi:Transposase DDE domain
MKRTRKSSGAQPSWGTLAEAARHLLPADIFACFAAHGNTSWTARVLALTAVAWAWSSQASLSDRFEEARQFVERQSARRLPSTYQGFVAALERWTDCLMAVILNHWRRLAQDRGGAWWKIGRFVPLAVDGTRIQTPRTRSNEARFTAQRSKGSRKSRDVQPQLWLTLLWHAQLRLPWAWRLGPYDASERDHLARLRELLPASSLVLGDAGFTGYAGWKGLLDGGHHFVMRVGAHVRLLRALGCVRTQGEVVFLWPDEVRRRQEPPLVLRLVRVRTRRRTIYLVTSVLDPNELGDQQIAELYRLRWGIEVFVRTFKQTFHRSRLRSAAADNAIRELEWSLLGLMGLQLLGVEALVTTGQAPARLSTAGALRAVRRRLIAACSDRPDQLRSDLASAHIDHYARRYKTSRRYPRKKRTRPPTRPAIRLATAGERAAAKPFLPTTLAI